MQPGLAECENAVLVPHIASATEWTRSGMVRSRFFNEGWLSEARLSAECSELARVTELVVFLLRASASWHFLVPYIASATNWTHSGMASPIGSP